MEHVILWICTAFALFVLTKLASEDWFHLSHPARRVMARVVGHVAHAEGGTRSFAPMFEFTGKDGQSVQVKDKVYLPRPKLTIGQMIEIKHPRGMPHRARISRPWLRAGIYVVVLYLLAVLVGRLTGWMGAGGGDVAGL